MGCYVPGRGFGPCPTCDDEGDELDEMTEAAIDYEVGLAW